MANSNVISITIIHNNAGLVLGFKVKNHGHPIVCSAVSALTINAVNSIESLTGLQAHNYRCKVNAPGGFIGFILKDSSFRNLGAGLLLDSLVLGLSGISHQYPSHVSFTSKYLDRK